MGRGKVIGVGTIVKLRFPVTPIGKADPPRDELHALGALLHREIEKEAQLAEEFLERGHLG